MENSITSILPQSSTAINISPTPKERSNVSELCMCEASDVDDGKRQSAVNLSIFGAVSVISSSVEIKNNDDEDYKMAYMVVTTPDKNKKLRNVEIIEKQLSEFACLQEDKEEKSEKDLNLEPPPLDEDGIIEDGDSEVEQDNNHPPSYWLRKRNNHKFGGLFPSNPDILFDWISDESPANSDEEAKNIDTLSPVPTSKPKQSSNEKTIKTKNPKYHETKTAFFMGSDTGCSSYEGHEHHNGNKAAEISSKGLNTYEHNNENENFTKSDKSSIPFSDVFSSSDDSRDTKEENCEQTEEFSKIHSDGLKIVLKRNEAIKNKRNTKSNHLRAKITVTSSNEVPTTSVETPTKATTEVKTNSSSELEEIREELLLTDSNGINETLPEDAVETIKTGTENISKASGIELKDDVSTSENCKSACGSSPPVCDEITHAESHSVETKQQCSKKRPKKKDRGKELSSSSVNSNQSSTEAADTGMRLSLEFIHHNWLERQLKDKMRLKRFIELRDVQLPDKKRENDQKNDDTSKEHETHREDKTTKALIEKVKEAAINYSNSTSKEEDTSSSNASLVSAVNLIADTAPHNVIGIVKPFQRCNKATMEQNGIASDKNKLKITPVSQNMDDEIVKDAIKVSSETNLGVGDGDSLKSAKDTLPEFTIEKCYSLAVYPVRRNGQAWDLTSKDKTDSTQYCGALDLSKKLTKMTAAADRSEEKSENNDQNPPPGPERELSTKTETTVESPKSFTTNGISNIAKSKPFVVFSTVNSSTKLSLSSMAPRTNGNLSSINNLDIKSSKETKGNGRKLSFDENKLYDIVRPRNNESDVLRPHSNLNVSTFQPPTSYKAQQVTVSNSSTTVSETGQKTPIPLSIASDTNRVSLYQPTSTTSSASLSKKGHFLHKYRRGSSEKRMPSMCSSSTESIIIDVEAFDDHIEEIRPRSSQRKRTSPFSSSSYKLNLISTPSITQSRRFSQPTNSTSQVVLQTTTPPFLNGLCKKVEKEVDRQSYAHHPVSTDASSRNTTVKQTIDSSNYFRQQIVSKVNEAGPKSFTRIRTQSSNFHAPEKVSLEHNTRVGAQRVGNVNPRLVMQHNGGTNGHRNNPTTAPLLSPHSADFQRIQRNANLLRQPVKPCVSGYIKVGACGPVVQYPPNSPIQRHPEPVLAQTDTHSQHYQSPIKPTPVRTQQVQYPPCINRFPPSSNDYRPRSNERKTEHPSGASTACASTNRSPSRPVAFSKAFYMPRPQVVRAPPGGVSINSTPILQTKHNFPTRALPRPVPPQKEVKRIPEIPAGPMNPPGLKAMSNEEAARFAAHLNAQKVELENQIRKLEMLENKIYAPRRAPETTSVKHPPQDPAYASFLETRKRKASSSQYPALQPHHNVKMLSYNLHQPPPHKVMHSMLSPHAQGAIERDRAPAIEEKCGVCRKKAFFVCSGCRGIWYCSKNCQFEDWTKHSQACS